MNKVAIKIIVIFLAPLVHVSTYAQTIKVTGYREIIEGRFAKGGQENWFGNIDDNVENIIDIALYSNKKINFLIPIRCITKSDTTVLFYTSEYLRRYAKKPVRFNEINSINKDKARFSLPLRELTHYSVDFDSIYSEMQNNPLINFDPSKFELAIRQGNSLFCKRFEMEKDRYSFYYLLFINGILLSEDPHTNSVFFRSY